MIPTTKDTAQIRDLRVQNAPQDLREYCMFSRQRTVRHSKAYYINSAIRHLVCIWI
jgi:hypothetical protein